MGYSYRTTQQSAGRVNDAAPAPSADKPKRKRCEHDRWPGDDCDICPAPPAAQPAEPTATDAPCSSCGQTAGFHTLRCRDKNAASELRATHCSNEGLHDSAADLIERQAREIERWRNVTARADPDDCAAGIKELYGRWKDAEAERDALRADAERYRKVRDLMTHEHSGPHVGWTLGVLLSGDDPDAAIDAVREKVR